MIGAANPIGPFATVTDRSVYTALARDHSRSQDQARGRNVEEFAETAFEAMIGKVLEKKFLEEVSIRSFVTVLIAFVSLSLTSHDAAASNSFGRYYCTVEKIYGQDALGRRWKGAKLIFDADAGVLDVSLDVLGESMPLKRMLSRISVVKVSSAYLHAVQYDPPERSYHWPFLAWLMLETLDNPRAPRFQFFSTGIRSIAAGQCVRQ